MKIEIEILGPVATQQGADVSDLEADLQAEADSFANHVDASKPQANRKPAPKDAQSEFELIQFIIEVAKEPAAIKAAINVLIYGANEISSAKSKSKEEDEDEKKSIRMKLLGKEIALPASVAVIKQFIEEITKDG
jgi:hypothetical protein